MKYSLTYNNEIMLYAKKPHYVCYFCTAAQNQYLLPSKVIYLCEFIGKEVLLNIDGNREKTTPEMNFIDDKNAVLESIPRKYHL